jgi:hypothetical protein
MSTSAGLSTSGYNLFRILVVVNIVYMFAYSVRSHMFMNIVTSLLLLSFFWIKLLVKLAKFPTMVNTKYLVCLKLNTTAYTMLQCETAHLSVIQYQNGEQIKSY